MVKVGVITVSDKGSSGEREDLGGPLIREIISSWGWKTGAAALVPDEQQLIEQKLAEFADDIGVDIIFTTGGTGFSPRDVTPEATLAVVERLAPGIAEAMRAESMRITSRAMLSRAVSGIRGKTLIINLPGSPKGVRECLEIIRPGIGHGIDILRGITSDCADLRK